MKKKMTEKQAKLFLEAFEKAIDELVKIIKPLKKAFKVLEPYFFGLYMHYLGLKDQKKNYTQQKQFHYYRTMLYGKGYTIVNY